MIINRGSMKDQTKQLAKSRTLWLAGCTVGMCSLWLSIATAETLQRIQVQGLKHLSNQTVLEALPIKIGDRLDGQSGDQVIKALYQTGIFSQVEATINHGVLSVQVQENRIISDIVVEGCHNVKRKTVDNILQQLELTVGRPINYAKMHSFKYSLESYYRELGMHQVSVDLVPQNENSTKVKLLINVNEGLKAKVAKIKIVGNRALNSHKIKSNISTKTSDLLSWFTDNDVYSEEKLANDLETIRKLYGELGYLKAKVTLQPVEWTKNGQKACLTFQVEEGVRYRIRSVQLQGQLVGKDQELHREIRVKAGDIASTAKINADQEAISDRLGDFGYGLAMVYPDYQYDQQEPLIDLRFMVRAGKRVVARQINFVGNVKTKDEVLRREMRIQEGGTFSVARLKESERRLANLGYLENVTYSVSEVPEADNQVDISYNFKEVSSTSFGFNVGMTNHHSIVYGANLSDINFLGTGKSASIRFDSSNFFQSYGLHYYDPYFTDDHVGFGLDLTYEAYNPHRVDKELSDYRRRTYGITACFDQPLSDFTSFYYGAGLEHISIPGRPTYGANPKIEAFLDKYGSTHNNLKIITGISYSNLDRVIFPRKGFFGSLGLELYLPISHKDLGYYRSNVKGSYYYPIDSEGDWVVKLNGELAYGGGFTKTHQLPFYKRYFAGGIGSVRGFSASTLCPQEDAHRVIGGNLLVLGSAALILPSPYPNTMRISGFVDMGNVYTDHFCLKELRASAGMQLEIRTPMAPVVLSLAKPIRKQPWDEKELFQFSLNASI